MIQGPVFLNVFHEIHRCLLGYGKVDETPHVIVLDGEALHMMIKVIHFTIANNLVIFQLILTCRTPRIPRRGTLKTSSGRVPQFFRWGDESMATTLP